MLTQRIIIRSGGNDFDMTGYLLLRPDGSWLAVALGDMGMELFRLSFDGTTAEVIKRPDSVPLRPLLEGIAGDIHHLIGMRPGMRAHLVRRTSSVIGLAVEHDDGTLDEYQFARDDATPSRSLGVVDGKIVREVSYTEPTRYDKRTILLPRRALLHNHRWHYSMEVVLLKMRTMPSPRKEGHPGAKR
jgi:hypothetical protein